MRTYRAAAAGVRISADRIHPIEADSNIDNGGCTDAFARNQIKTVASLVGNDETAAGSVNVGGAYLGNREIECKNVSGAAHVFFEMSRISTLPSLLPNADLYELFTVSSGTTAFTSYSWDK